MEIPTARPRSRHRANPPAPRDGGRSKHTLLLEDEISRKLSVAASLRGMDRSDLVNEVLRDALRYISIVVRGTRGGSADVAGPVESPMVEAA